MKTISLLLVIALAISCDKDPKDPCEGLVVSAELNAEVNAVNNAVDQYVLDPSASNCNVYTSAIDNFNLGIDEILEGDCTDAAIVNDAIDLSDDVNSTLRLALMDNPQNEIDAYIAALNNYNQNPTQANCLAYKNALQAYVDELSYYYSCPAGPDFTQAINEAQAQIDALQC